MKKLGLILLVLSSLLSINKANAWCIVGSDMTWRCVGQDSFIIKLQVYMDCNGVNLGASPITFKCATTGATITTLTIAVGTPVDITPVCNSSCSRCSSVSCSFPYGIRRYTMQGLVKLNGAGSCCNIAINWEWCCRNGAITTGAADQNFFNTAKLNRCLNPCDNSPVFTNTPIGILCVNQDFSFNHGAQDMDVNNTGGLSDSLTTEWAQPLKAANTPISYISPYAYNKAIYFYGFPNDALPWPTGIHLDPLTGDIQFRPTKAEVTVMVVQVNEFRNGVKIGEVRRDMEIFVIPCTSNNPPVITTPGNVRSKTVCAGDTVKFNFTTNDANANDSVRISWDNSLSGAIWIHTNGQAKHPTATLTWTPTLSKAGSLPYYFTVTVKDNACPLRAQLTQSYQVFVKAKPKANIIVSDSGCGKYYFKAVPIAGIAPTYLWSGNSFTFSPNTGSLVSHNFTAGSYPFQLVMTSQGCSQSFYDTVDIDPIMSVYLPADTSVWANSTITLRAAVVNPIIPYKLKWGSGKFTFPGDTAITKQITVIKDTTIWVRASYGSVNCPFDEIRIKVHSKYKISLPKDTFFCGLNNSLSPTLTPDISAFRTFKWYKPGSSVVIDADALLNASDTGIFICVATDTFGCVFSDTIHIHKNPSVVAAALGNTICYGADAELEANSTGGGSAVYYWYAGTKLVGNTKKIKVKPLVTTDYKLKVIETLNGLSCMDSVMVRVNVNPLPAIKINPIDKRCINGTIISLNNFVTIDGIFKTGGIWSSPSAGLIYGDKFNPVAAGVSTPPGWKVKYEYTNPTSGCYNKDSGYVTINDLPKPYAGKDDSICKGAPMVLTGLPQTPPGTWRGTGVEGSSPNWRFNPDAAGIVDGGKYEAIYHYKDYNQCENEDTLSISVFNAPVADAGSPKQFCEGMSPFTLTGSPAGGKWTGTGLTGNQFFPSTPGIHVLTYTYTNVVCSVYDQVNYIVYPKPGTAIISFSPSDSFLECNLTNGSYKWFYRIDTFTAPTIIGKNLRRINPKTYCKKCYFNVIFTDANGCVSDTSAAYHFVFISVEKISHTSAFIFYPNPAHSELFVENPDNETSSMMLTDIYGKTLLETKIKPGKNAITIQNYKPGLYFIFMDGMITGKLLIE